MARPTLSLVVPIYNEEGVIPELETRLRATLSELESIVDRSLELLAEMARMEPRFRLLSFSRNFGHQLAITAGLDRAEGDAVVVIDIKSFAAGVVTGWTTIMMLTAFGFSAQLLMTGILGEYLDRIYEEVKRRPLYIAAKELNFTVPGPADSVRPQNLERRE